MTITEKQRRRLVEIREQVKNLQRKEDELVAEAEVITGEQEEGGHTFDYVLNGAWEVGELLDRLGIEIEK